MWRKFVNWSNAIWVIGRRSETAYLRFYPNFGFMIPWRDGKTLRWSKHYGLSIRRSK